MSALTSETYCPPHTERPLLEVRDLSVAFTTSGQRVDAVEHLGFRLSRGQCLALVGESGAGKSVSCRALLGLLPGTATVSGSVLLNDTSLLCLSEREWRQLRGSRIAMVFQDPSRSLNPTMRVGHQISEVIHRHHPNLQRAERRQRTIELLRLLNIPEPERRFLFYPHELSGGMRQRVLIAIALAGNPELLIADEPMRSLDVITQSETLALLRNLQYRFRLALLIVSHDLRLVSCVADDILVMQAGHVVEYGPASRLLNEPRMPYTKALTEAMAGANRLTPATSRPMLAANRPPSTHTHIARGALPEPVSTTRLRTATPACRHATADTVLRAVEIMQEFPLQAHGVFRAGSMRALDKVSFDLRSGETLGIVGESGAGKTTLARALAQAPKPASGSVYFEGVDLTLLRGRNLVQHRRRMQLVFQDPFGSLDPSWRVEHIVEEPLRRFTDMDKTQRRRAVGEILDRVGIPIGRYGQRRPARLSGGECQRVSLARALTAEPALLILDEAVSALDVLTQAQLLELFRQLRSEFGLSYLFISHDLALVRQVSDRVAVLHVGLICEIGPALAVLSHPRHPYTASLLAHALQGTSPGTTPPAPDLAPPSDDPPPSSASCGCAFRARCPRARGRCTLIRPELLPAAGEHLVACHFPLPVS